MRIININITAPGIYERIHAKQQDTARSFSARLWSDDGATPWEPPAGAIWSAWYAGPSGIGNYTDNITQSGNTVTVRMPSQMLTNPGCGVVCLVCNAPGGVQLGAWNVPYEVEPVPGIDSQAVTEWLNAFSETAGQVAESAAAAQASADAAAQSAQDAAAQVVGAVKSVNGVTPDSAGAVTLDAAALLAVREMMMPVGTIIEWLPVDGGAVDLSTAEKVAAYYGFGTWRAITTMLLGASTQHPAGSTGGAEAAAIRTEELPGGMAPVVVYKDANNTIGFGSGNDNVQFTIPWNSGESGANRAQLDVQLPGNGELHPNMPPYTSVYIWQRIA